MQSAWAGLFCSLNSHKAEGLIWTKFLVEREQGREGGGGWGREELCSGCQSDIQRGQWLTIHPSRCPFSTNTLGDKL